MRVIQLINRLARVPDRDVDVLIQDSSGKTYAIEDKLDIKGTTVVILKPQIATEKES